MRLFIAEKPELARAIVEGLGGGEKKNGYYQCGNDAVTWCFGHMLQLLDPEEYDPKYKQWNAADLPFSFIPWKKRPVDKSKQQLNIVAGLVKRADVVVNAGDPDPEGQLLVDEILQYADFRGPVKRVLINDNTPAVVRKSLANLRDNSEFTGLSAAAEARQVGDQLYGYNLTRLYTIVAKHAGFQSVLSVGRVQTPILGLVVRRDRENAGHQKQEYYVVRGTFSVNGLSFPAVYQVEDGDPVDDKNRLNDMARAGEIVATVTGKPATIVEADTTTQDTPPPLPYNLLKLQTDAARLYRLKPDAVKDITQTLREKHRLITYNRSDCQYLSEEQHADAAGVLAAIAATNPDLAGAVGKANPVVKSRAFDSAKISAHHAIIPTAATVDFSQLSRDEQKIYSLIARAYVAQFWPAYQYEQTTITASVEGLEFSCKTHVPLASGWKELYGKDAVEDDADADDDVGASLKDLAVGHRGECDAAGVLTKETKPRPLYTMATLLGDLTRVAQYVKDDATRKLLLDKDKGKAGEHGGIGTPATRDSIIALLFKRGFIEERKGKVVSTKAGQDFYDALPDRAKYPDMTAIWHGQQKDIEAGSMGIDAFIKSLVDYLADEVYRVQNDGIGVAATFHACPDCGKALVKRKGKNGPFWGCTGYPDCKASLPDKDGKPGERAASSRSNVSEIHNCMACGKGLVRRPTKDGKRFWWGCSGFPDCKQMYYDDDGKPKYSAAETKKSGRANAK